MGRFIATGGGGSLGFPIMSLGLDWAVFVLWLGSRLGSLGFPMTVFVFVVRIRLCLCLCLWVCVCGLCL